MLYRSFIMAALVCVFGVGVAFAQDGRSIKDLDAARIEQPDFVKARSADKCPQGTVFTQEAGRNVWCRVCPDGLTYYQSARICASCPAGTEFVPPYEMAGKRYNLGGLCVKYSSR